MRRRQYPAPDERRCTHINASGQRCAQWKMKVYETCPSHTPEIREKLGPATKDICKGQQNRYKSGCKQRKPFKPLATLEDILDDLLIHHSQLSLAISDKGEELPLAELAQVVSLQVANALRIARMMKEQQAGEPDLRDRLLNQALDELSEEWGIRL